MQGDGRGCRVFDDQSESVTEANAESIDKVAPLLTFLRAVKCFVFRFLCIISSSILPSCRLHAMYKSTQGVVTP